MQNWKNTYFGCFGGWGPTYTKFDKEKYKRHHDIIKWQKELYFDIFLSISLLWCNLGPCLHFTQIRLNPFVIIPANGLLDICNKCVLFLLEPESCVSVEVK